MVTTGSGSFATADARLAAIIGSSDDAIYSKDRDACLTSWNPAAERLYGYKADEVLGRSVAILIPESRTGEEIDILNRILAGERVEYYETERMTKHGRLVKVSVSASPITDAAGEIVEVSVIARDIGERLELAALRKELERNEFVNLVAHELKNPLSTISGAAQILEMDLDSLPQRAVKAVDLLLRQTDRAQILIRDLLDLSRLRSGRFAMEASDVELRASIEDTLAVMIPPEGKRVDVRVDPGLKVIADPTRLQQIVTNLLSNAYKYGGDSITIEAAARGPMVTVTVSDDGRGLPGEYRPHVFEPFVRGHSSGAAGSGLGLAITKALVEAHRGTIRHDAEAPGARFTFLLPAA